EPAEAEIRAEVKRDQPCNEQGFSRVAQAEEAGAPDVPAVRQIGREIAGNRPGCHAPSRPGPERNQRSRRDTDGWPEYGVARLGQQEKAQARGQEIGEADRDGQLHRADPLLSRAGIRAPGLFPSTLQHAAPSSRQMGGRMTRLGDRSRPELHVSPTAGPDTSMYICKIGARLTHSCRA